MRTFLNANITGYYLWNKNAVNKVPATIALQVGTFFVCVCMVGNDKVFVY